MADFSVSTAPVGVRYFAGAADAAGTHEESVDLPTGSTIATLVHALVDRHGDALAKVLDVAVFLVGDDLVRDRDHPVGDAVDVLPPFAGG